MSARTHATARRAPSLSVAVVAVMLLAAVAIFATAYAVAAVFGRDSDGKVTDLDARVVPAMEMAGTPLLTVTARGVAFDTDAITVPAGQTSQIRLDNIDAGIYHNIAVYADRAAEILVIRGKLFDGPNVRDYFFDALPAGVYYFQCDLHPAMNGAFNVE